MTNDEDNAMFADDCEAVLRLLIDEGPQTMDGLTEKTGRDRWRMNEILTSLLLAGRVRPQPGRQRNRKVTFYEIKATN